MQKSDYNFPLKDPPKISLTYLAQHFDIIRQLTPYIWVKDWRIRIRYLILIGLSATMIGLNILTPIVLMKIVFLLSENNKNLTQIYIFLLLYGGVWTISQSISLLREFFLFKAVERSVRLICHDVSSHIHKLSYDFHTTQKTGALVSYIEKTYRAFPCVFWGFTLNVIPTIKVYC